MAEYLIQDSTLAAIAEAIKAKIGKDDPIKVAEYAAKILGIKNIVGDLDAAYLTFLDQDETELYIRPVFVGDDCEDPVAQGRITTPTKESTVQYDYNFTGWSEVNDGSVDELCLKDITDDKTLYAIYEAVLRYYNAKFYDDTTLLETLPVAYGQTANPTCTRRPGYKFNGWTPSDLTITKDTDFYGSFEKNEDWYIASTLASRYLYGVNVAKKQLVVRGASSSSSFQTSTVNLTSPSIGTPTTPTIGNGSYTAFTSDGNTMFVSYDSSIITAYAVSSSSYSKITSVTFGTYCEGLIVSPDNKYVVVAGRNQNIYVYSWNGSTLTLSHTISNMYFSSYTQSVMSFSKDGTKLACASYNSTTGNRLHVFDASNNFAELSVFGGNFTESTKNVCFVGDLLVVGLSNAPYLRIYDTSATPYSEINTDDLNIVMPTKYLDWIISSPSDNSFAYASRNNEFVVIEKEMIDDEIIYTSNILPLYANTYQPMMAAYLDENSFVIGSYINSNGQLSGAISLYIKNPDAQ